MSGTVGNIVVRVGASAEQLESEMKKASNTILTFKNESMTALKSFGIPRISSTNPVESIQSGQRVIANFAQESGETLEQFQQRVRTVFKEAGVDITAYERALEGANQIHAEFAKGAVKSFQAARTAIKETAEAAGKEEAGAVAADFKNMGSSIFKDVKDFGGNVVNAFKTITDGSASFGAKFGAVSQAVTSGFGIMSGAVEVFLAIEVVKKVGEWTELKHNSTALIQSGV